MRVREGDWLKTFKEEGQTFEEYVAGNPTLPTGERRVIYIQPIGNFTATQKKVLRLTAEYMEAFFNLPVRLNEVRPLGPVPREMRRKNPYEGQDQIRTGYFLDDVLPKMLPGDAAALICFTDTDLFPDETFNYVFGQASLSKRVGAWSLWRFGDPDKSPEDYALFLKRVLKVGMHETGHMFSMAHCTKYECLMSGSNHLQESDRRPLDLCPECMLKIAWGMNYAPADRYGNLKRFWEKLGWEKEAGECARKEEAVLSVN
ncbi:MAG: archaemetzincin [Pyrinomonadaceae bacterium]